MENQPKQPADDILFGRSGCDVALLETQTRGAQRKSEKANQALCLLSLFKGSEVESYTHRLTRNFQMPTPCLQLTQGTQVLSLLGPYPSYKRGCSPRGLLLWSECFFLSLGLIYMLDNLYFT